MADKAGMRIDTEYTGRHVIRVERKAVRYVRVTIVPAQSRGGIREGTYVDLSARDALVTAAQMIRTALRALVARA